MDIDTTVQPNIKYCLGSLRLVWSPVQQVDTIGEASWIKGFNYRLFIAGKKGLHSFSTAISNVQIRYDFIKSDAYALNTYNNRLMVSGHDAKGAVRIFELNNQIGISDTLPFDFRDSINAMFEWNDELYLGGAFAVVKDEKTGKDTTVNHLIKWSKPNSISEHTTQTNIYLWPNPTTGIVYIGNTAHYNRITVTDITGREVYSAGMLLGNRIDLSDQPPGIYFLRADNAATVKIIISR
jgi:hypothetical protein